MSEFPTVGVEEEFLLVDPRTGEPAPHNAAVAAEAERRGITLQLELSGCQVETTSSVAATSAELGEELTRLRRTAAEAAEAAGVQLLALGLPPVTPHDFPVSGTERYRRIGAEFGMIAHEQGICGCHVHVQVPDRAAAIRKALKEARPGDVVVLAGKGHETYQVLKDKTIAFDDRVVARDVLRTLGYDQA